MPGEVDPPDLGELGEFITKMAGAGMTLFPDPDLEDFVRDAAKLPEKSEEVELLQQQQKMADQQAAAMAPAPPGLEEDEFGGVPEEDGEFA